MFSAVHLHLAVNHSPLYGEVFAFFLVLIGVIRRNRTLVTAGYVFAIFAAAGAIVSDQSGDGAARYLKQANLAGVDMSLVREHDQAATFAVASTCIAAALSVVAMWLGRGRERRRWLDIVIIVVMAWSISVVARVALLGGRIHHQEVRPVVQA